MKHTLTLALAILLLAATTERHRKDGK